MFKRDGYRYVMCDGDDRLTIDHIHQRLVED
jgi:hypothetical protein